MFSIFVKNTRIKRERELCSDSKNKNYQSFKGKSLFSFKESFKEKEEEEEGNFIRVYIQIIFSFSKYTWRKRFDDILSPVFFPEKKKKKKISSEIKEITRRQR